MDIFTRTKYADYIATGVRFATQEKGLPWPDTTIIITKPWSELSKLDTLLGWPIYVTEMQSAYDFHLSIPANEESSRKLLKSFDEYLNLYSLDLEDV